MEITNSNFQKEVIESKLPVLLDFWAPWCGPCKASAPQVEALAKKYSDKIKVGKLNVDEAGEIATQFAVMSIPTFMIFKNGKIMEKKTGAMVLTDLEKFVAPYLANVVSNKL
jgi:thioredoxin 1